MKLSTLIDYRNQLEKSIPRDYAQMVDKQVGDSLYLVKNHEPRLEELADKLVEKNKKIHQAFDDYSQTLNGAAQTINALIDDLEPQYFADSYRNYSNEFINDTVECILNRRLNLTEISRTHLSARIKRHGDWQHAGMIIRPGIDDWTEDLVGCDPLYLVDKHIDLLRPTVEKFPPQYRGRLRMYLLDQTKDGNLLDFVPNEQFAFCLIYYFFNFLPLELIKSYLTEVYQKLKPGGTLAFTFNDCDQPGGVMMVENHFMCYTPGKLLLALAENIGYQVVHTYRIDNSAAWVEIQKPGTLTSLRGGQAMAKIISKTIDKSK